MLKCSQGMCYIRHHNKSSNWYHFRPYTATVPEISFSFSSGLINSLLHAGSQDFDQALLQFIYIVHRLCIHATVHSPKCFSCVVWCMTRPSSFLAENNVVNIADIRFCTSCSWYSAIVYRYWYVFQFSLISLKIIQNCFYVSLAGNSLTLSWLRNF